MKRLVKLLKFNKSGKHYLFVQRVIQTEQISVLEAIKFFLSFWRIVVGFAIVFLIASFIISLYPRPESYTSTSVVIPDGGAPPKQSVGSELEDLIQQQVQSSGDLGVESFPGIIENYPFLLNLIDEKILSEKYGGYIELGEYVSKMNQPSSLDNLIGKVRGLPDRFLGLFKPDEDPSAGPIVTNNMPIDTLKVVTLRQLGLMSLLSEQIKVEGNNSITIETEMPEAKVSTRLNSLVFEKLVEEVTRIKTAKQQRDLSLIGDQLDTAKTNFEISQNNLAKFRDTNKGNNSAAAQTELERLTTEYNLYFTLYSSLATEYELAKIELIQNIPFYDVIEPAYVPLLPNNAGGVSISALIKSVLIGIALGIVFIVIYSGLLILRLLNDKLKETNL